MKKLSNISPFLLLMFPVLVLLLFTLTTSANNATNNEVLTKKSTSNPATFITKAAIAIFK